jgi:hypothetical protein
VITARRQNQHAFDINTGWFETEYAPTNNQKLSISYTRQQSGLVLLQAATLPKNAPRYISASAAVEFFQLVGFELISSRLEG